MTMSDVDTKRFFFVAFTALGLVWLELFVFRTGYVNMELVEQATQHQLRQFDMLRHAVIALIAATACMILWTEIRFSTTWEERGMAIKEFISFKLIDELDMVRCHQLNEDYFQAYMAEWARTNGYHQMLASLIAAELIAAGTRRSDHEPGPSTWKLKRPNVVDVVRRIHAHFQGEAWALGTRMNDDLDRFPPRRK